MVHVAIVQAWLRVSEVWPFVSSNSRGIFPRALLPGVLLRGDSFRGDSFRGDPFRGDPFREDHFLLDRLAPVGKPFRMWEC